MLKKLYGNRRFLVTGRSGSLKVLQKELSALSSSPLSISCERGRMKFSSGPYSSILATELFFLLLVARALSEASSDSPETQFQNQKQLLELKM